MPTARTCGRRSRTTCLPASARDGQRQLHRGSASTIFAQTAGRRESGAPVYTFGGRVQAPLGPLELGLQAKRTGPRYVNDDESAAHLVHQRHRRQRLCERGRLPGAALTVPTRSTGLWRQASGLYDGRHRCPAAARLPRPQRRHLLPVQRHQRLRQILCRQCQQPAAEHERALRADRRAARVHRHAERRVQIRSAPGARAGRRGSGRGALLFGCAMAYALA